MLTCIPDILDWTEIKKIRAAIAEGEFEDGKKTAGYRAKRVKHNLQMDRNSEAAKAVKAIILTGLRRNPTFQRVALPKTIRPPLISRYQEGMNYGLHVDDAMMGGSPKERTDISVTVFLSDPGDYDGGETVMNSPFGEQEIKLPAGAAVVYPSSTLHRVAPVTRGERLAAVTWLQSYVRDPAKREILHDIYQMREALAKLHPDDEEADLAFKTYANLLRMWSE
jgi:PKHD-type hydroxylase